MANPYIQSLQSSGKSGSRTGSSSITSNSFINSLQGISPTPSPQPTIITPPKSNIFQQTISKIFPKKQPVKELADKQQPQIFQKLFSPGTKATVKSMGENVKVFLSEAKKKIEKELSDFRLVKPAYAPARERKDEILPTGEKIEHKPIEDLVKEYQATPLYKVNRISNIFMGNLWKGVTGGIIKPETDSPENLKEKVARSTGEILGTVTALRKIHAGLSIVLAGTGTVGAMISKYPRLAKWAIPLISNVGTFNIYGQLDPDIENRLKTVAEQTLLAVPFSLLGAIPQAKFSVPASFGLGFGLTKLSGGDNEDAFINGFILGILDGAGRLGKKGNVNKRVADKVMKQESLKVLNKYSSVKLNNKSSQAEIRKAYIDSVQKHHPDKGGDPNTFKSIVSAYEFLSGKTIAPEFYEAKEAEPAVEPEPKTITSKIEVKKPAVVKKGAAKPKGKAAKGSLYDTKSFIKEAHSTAKMSVGDTITIDDVDITFKSASEPNTIRIENIEAFTKGEGAGSKALDRFTKLADKHGVKILANAEVTEKGGLNLRQLKDFYKRHGFSVDEYGQMEKLPGVAQLPVYDIREIIVDKDGKEWLITENLGKNKFKATPNSGIVTQTKTKIVDGKLLMKDMKGKWVEPVAHTFDASKLPLTQLPTTKKAPVKPAKKKVVKKKKPVKIVKEKGRKLTLGVTKAKPEKQFEESVGVGLVPGRIGRPDIDKGYARPTIGKTELKTIFANNPEFEANPVLTVDKDKNLIFVGGEIKLKIFPEAMNLNRENLHPGDKVFVDEESFKKAGRKQQTRVYRGGKAIASFESTPLSEFEDRGVPKKGTYEFKLFNKTRALIKKYAQSVGEGYLPRKALGVYLPRTKNIRVNAINDLAVISHEITHFLDFHYKISNVLMAIKGYSRSGNPIYDSNTAKYRKAITDLYTSYYPGGKATHKLRKRTLEGFATLLQKYVEMPTKITEQYPLLVKSFLKPGGKYYEPIMNEIIKDLNEIVAEYQGLSSLEKIGSTITSGDLNVDKESFLGFFDKVRENIADKIYPTEVLAIKAKVHFTVKDPSLWLRAYNNINSIISNNIATDRGYWSLKGNTFVKLHDYNWKTLVDLTAQRKNTEDFASYLVARDQHFNHLELDKLKEDVVRVTKEIKEAGGAKAAKDVINASTGQSLLDEAKEIIANYKELRSVLSKNAFSRADVDKAFEENEARFKEEAQLFDSLTREDLNLLNNETVGLVTPKQYDKLTSKQGYASMKRKFYDELVGDSDAFPSQVKVGKTKVSSLLRRKGSQRTIINPLYSGMVNHHEALKKGLRQVVFNKFADIGVSVAFPNLFEKLQLKSYKDEFTGAIVYPQEKDSNIIMGRLNYKRTPVLVDAGVKSTIDNILTYDNIDIFIKLYTGLSRAFTAGTTGFYPQFAATNFVRDQVTAQANTTNKYKTIFSPLAQFSKIITNRGGIDSQYYREYMVMGGERQTFTGWQKLPPEKLFKKIAKEKNGLQRAIDLLEKGTDVLSIPSKYSEIVTRATEYIKARKAGKPQIVALEEAGRVTAPFHHIGKWGGKYGETFIRGLPFFNATIQVLDQHMRTMGTKQGRNRMAFVLLAITAAYIASMASLLNNASDEQKEQYKDLDPEQLAGFLFFPNPSGKGLIRLAISNVFSPLGSVINMVIADKVMKANYSTRNYFDAVTSMIPDQFDPTEPVKAFLAWIPQIFQAGIETAFGVKSYPKVRPLESMGQRNLPPHLRKNENTSKFAVWLGEKINLSPLKIDHLITGYFGRSIGFATGQPSAWDFKSSVLRDYWFSNGRRITGVYELREKNNQNYTAYQRGEIELNEDEVKELYRIKVLTNEFNDVMGDYRVIDIEKNPEEAGKLRNEALTVLEKIESGEEPKKFNTWVRDATKRRRDKLKEIEKKEKQSFNIKSLIDANPFKATPVFAAEAGSFLGKELLATQKAIQEKFKKQLELLETESPADFERRQRKVAEGLRKNFPKFYRDKIGKEGERAIFGKEVTNWDELEKDIIYKDIDNNFARQSTNAKRVLKGENARLQTGKEADAFNRINPDTGRHDKNSPITQIPNTFTGKKENSIDRGLFRINNQRFWDILGDSRKGYRDAMFRAGIIDSPHPGRKGLTSKKQKEYWDRMLDPEMNTKMAKIIYDLNGWCGWFAAPNDLVKHCSWYGK